VDIAIFKFSKEIKEHPYNSSVYYIVYNFFQGVESDNMVGKDDFVSGFVPNHNHSSVDYTSVEALHVHQCLDITYPPTPSQCGSHTHYTQGYVLFENGHTHHYKAYSGPAIPVGDGMHVHYYDFYTSEDSGHRHHVKGTDNPAPGTI
jgi:hypothetical protein